MVTPIGWAIQDRSQHLAVDLYVWVVRAFVMPVFFWLSGYFARVVPTTAAPVGSSATGWSGSPHRSRSVWCRARSP